MTYKDALDSLCEDCVHYPCYALKHGDNCLAYNTIKEALEKQIPKKPVETEYFSKGCCPWCGEYIATEYSFPKHCEECGQAIDWSEEE